MSREWPLQRAHPGARSAEGRSSECSQGPASPPRPPSGMSKVAKQHLLKRLHTTPEPDTGPPPPLDLPPTPLPPDVREPAVPGQHPPVREPVWPGQSMSMAA